LTGTLIIFPKAAVPLFEAELLKGFRVQFGGIGTFLLHPGGLSEDVIAIVLPVLLPEGGSAFVAAGGTLIMPPEGGVPVLLLGFVALPTVPGGTLIILPRGGVLLLLVRGGALVGGIDVPVMLAVGLAKTQPDTQ
jgi:hypothetical protein